MTHDQSKEQIADLFLKNEIGDELVVCSDLFGDENTTCFLVVAPETGLKYKISFNIEEL